MVLQLVVSYRSETIMSTFTVIRDMSDSSLILNTLREVGLHFHQAILSSEKSQATPEAPSLSRLSLPDEVYKSTVGVLHPLAYYLQNKAQDLQKEKLAEILASDSETVEYLCEGIIHPYVKGILLG